MYIYNLKLNGNFLLKSTLLFILIVSIIILFISIYNVYHNTKFCVSDTILTNTNIEINSNQYTNILEEVYNNLDNYIGQNIKFTGYIYRKKDMKDNEFVLARDMLINSDSQSVVVGFLCNSVNAKKYKDGTWVSISGNIIKGYYHNQIPVIEITDIKEAKKPEEEYVYPPDGNYIPTIAIQ